MSQDGFASLTEQVASSLREKLMAGRWTGLMPGREKLAGDLNVSGKTVELALRILEKQGLLVNQGAGKRRKIVLESVYRKPPSLHIGILPFDPENARKGYMMYLKHRLIQAGHAVSVVPRSLTELNLEVARVAREVENRNVDAWVVIAGTSEVLGWFAAQGVPTFAVFGAFHSHPVAGIGPDKRSAYVAAVNRLVTLGHRHIVFVLRSPLVISKPTSPGSIFLDALESHGIPVGCYNLPDWEKNPEGLRSCLDSLFTITPPTAIMIDEAPLFIAVQQHLARRGILTPEDVSLICTDPDRAFSWCRPTIAHISWSTDPIIRRVVRWAGNISLGKDDRRTSVVNAGFVDGGTVAACPTPSVRASLVPRPSSF
jgi:DNA-binding LacI/PurR family transcriptional regulator